MYRRDNLPLIIRASTLRHLAVCERLIWLDAYGDADRIDEITPIQAYRLNSGVKHEKRINQAIAPSVPPTLVRSWAEGVDQTRQFIEAGVSRIIGGYFEAPMQLESLPYPLLLYGKIDQIIRLPTTAKHLYIPIEIKHYQKLTKADDLQLDMYVWLLKQAQNIEPPYAEFWLGADPLTNKPLARVRHKFDENRFMQAILKVAQILNPSLEPPVYIANYCATCRWHTHCRQQAQVSYDVSLIVGLRKDTHTQFRKAGISTLQHVVNLQPDDLRKFTGIKTTAEEFHMQARAWVEQKPMWLKSIPKLLNQGGWMFDLETYRIPHTKENVVWSIGLSNEDGKSAVVLIAPYGKRQLLSTLDDIEIYVVPDIETAWQWMAEIVQDDGKPIYHWTNYDKNVMQKSAPVKIHSALGDRLVDLYSVSKKTVRFPVSSLTIKSIAGYLGFKWSGYDNYLQAYMDYTSWLSNDDMEKLFKSVRYQADDVKALAVIWQYMIDNTP